MLPKKICVIGLGHFGYNLAVNLAEAGAEVLAIDHKDENIELIMDKVTHAVCMDATDRKSMDRLGLQEMDAVVVAIGEGFESSILTTAILQEMGIKTIYNRVISPIHERLLKQMNVTELLVPEADAARQLKDKLMIPGLIESFEISKIYSIFEIKTPEMFVGKKLIDLQLRQEYSLNLVTIKRPGQKKGFLIRGESGEYISTGVPSPDDKILKDDILVLFGKEKDVRNLLEEK